MVPKFKTLTLSRVTGKLSLTAANEALLVA
jgi:hypothetical protein